MRAAGLLLLWLLAVPQDEPAPAGQALDAREARVARVLAGEFAWTASAPLLGIVPSNLPPSDDNPWFAVKDPSVVRHEGRWHLFGTLRKTHGRDGKPPGYIRIGTLSFADWKDAPSARWHLLDLSLGYHGAPQVFWFAPQKRWYLVYQCEDETRGLAYGPCISTADDLAKPETWTKPAPLYAKQPDAVPGWLDFWLIADAGRMHLFFTDLRGAIWRAETRLADFPGGFGEPVVALRGDIFEASHTYRLAGRPEFLTLIEAQDGPRRYYKAYLADRLDGAWRSLADTRERPFAGRANVAFGGTPWTESISHGELLRTGIDERCEVDPADLRFLFQGASEPGRWRLGLLTPR